MCEKHVHLSFYLIVYNIYYVLVDTTKNISWTYSLDTGIRCQMQVVTRAVMTIIKKNLSQKQDYYLYV